MYFLSRRHQEYKEKDVESGSEPDSTNHHHSSINDSSTGGASAENKA